MPISTIVYKDEPGMTMPKFMMRATHLELRSWSGLKIEPYRWSVNVSGVEDATKLDEAPSRVILNISRETVETLLDYSDASSNDDFSAAMADLRKSYTRKT